MGLAGETLEDRDSTEDCPLMDGEDAASIGRSEVLEGF